MQVNSAQDYLTAQKRQIVAKMSVDSPQPANRRYNYVYISQAANGASQFEKIPYPQTLSLAAGSTPGLRYTSQDGIRPMFSWCCDPYLNSRLAAAALARPLYAFTTFTFTPAGATGRNGPTLSAAVSAYTATAPWATNTSYLNMTTQGYQLWTVPQTKSYTVTCAGAASAPASSGFGNGAIIQTTLSLTKGQILQILVGQRGVRNASTDAGGGGGSFVASGITPATGVCLVAAGGGAGTGGSSFGVARNDGTNSTTANNGGVGGNNGGSGGGGGTTTGSGDAGGGGFTGNGQSGSSVPGSGGLSFINGGTGGASGGTSTGGFGGGGGGGGGSSQGGGGGGYSGGGSGFGTITGGGGGGSFPAGATFIGATNNAEGYITITSI